MLPFDDRIPVSIFIYSITVEFKFILTDIPFQLNVFFGFISYYQLQGQEVGSCDFDGLGLVTFLDLSIGDCRFLVGVSDSNKSSSRRWSGSGIVMCNLCLDPCYTMVI